jgi:hypothetical protein
VIPKRKISALVIELIFALLNYPGSYSVKVKITPMINAYKRKGGKDPRTPDFGIRRRGVLSFRFGRFTHGEEAH